MKDPLRSEGVERLGRYRILRPIGWGAVGVVYLAEDELINRKVAVKVLIPDPRLSRELIGELHTRFKREAQAAGGLSHPNIVVIHDVGEEQGFPYMTMEYLPGQTLHQVISGGPILWEEAAGVVTEVLAALSYAHSRGVIHRDIKPENIFLLEDGRIKVTDFGIARMTSKGTVTAAGDIIGTPGYMSPEQIKVEPVGPQTDIFSTGVLLFELMSGTNPFDAGTPTAIIFKTVHEEPPSIDLKQPGVPSAFRQVLARALAKDQEDRYQSAGEMAEDIGRASRGEPVSALRAARPPRPSSPTVVGGAKAPDESRLTVVGEKKNAGEAVAYAPGATPMSSGYPDPEGIVRDIEAPAGQFQGVTRFFRTHLKKPDLSSATFHDFTSKVSVKTMAVAGGIAFILISLFLVLFLTHQSTVNRQKKHYLAGSEALDAWEYDTAINEFKQAGGYEDAEYMVDKAESEKKQAEETERKYVDAVNYMTQGQWQQANTLLSDIEAVAGKGYKDIAGRMDYIENCPQTPVRFSVPDYVNVHNSWCGSIPVNNLLGEQIAEVSVYRGANWDERPDFFINYSLYASNESYEETGVVLATCDYADIHKEGVGFVILGRGKQFNLEAGNWNYQFTIVDFSVTTSFPASDMYPAIRSLVLEFVIGLK
ncbi:MAG: serine/threonine protein kinase [Actinobacteria bacterium]|nr:serine/threonine protein kinase [Actinomycetota bacterium]MBU4360144.1 serine/threonine protein kinase [Actinomycetota bacterium]MBU4401763.1 serine/threonine protein kinase [Actinomycetota bacterium]MBU4442976.1 serine/threonine protein kinase [Actinomycetota bacterium]MCG2819520.1 serine/threonine protein kinase [Actinomycetes bacterium]